MFLLSRFSYILLVEYCTIVNFIKENQVRIRVTQIVKCKVDLNTVNYEILNIDIKVIKYYIVCNYKLIN